jgi:hypothetical protein
LNQFNQNLEFGNCRDFVANLKSVEESSHVMKTYGTKKVSASCSPRFLPTPSSNSSSTDLENLFQTLRNATPELTCPTESHPPKSGKKRTPKLEPGHGVSRQRLSPLDQRLDIPTSFGNSYAQKSK